MAYVNTPGGQFNGVVPDANEDPNIAYDLLQIAKAIEKRVMGVYATPAARNTATGTMGPVPGMFAFTLSDHMVSYYDGAAWQPFPPAVPAITSGTAAPSGGANGDIYFKI
jgi:hypothetical protein